VRVSTILATNVVDGTVFAYAYDDIGNHLSVRWTATRSCLFLNAGTGSSSIPAA